MKDIILIGGGGHCKSVIDTIRELHEYNMAGILDLKEKLGTSIDGVEIIGVDAELEYYNKQGIEYAFITLGSIGDTKLRYSIYQKALALGYKFPIIIDNTAIVSKNTRIGQGTFIGKGAIINTGTSIGMNCIINSGVIIDHDCNIGDFCHIAPGSTLSGGIIIGDSTHIGTNSTVIQNIRVGNNSIIGAGSVVVKDIGSCTKAYGNPCREVN